MTVSWKTAAPAVAACCAALWAGSGGSVAVAQQRERRPLQRPVVAQTYFERSFTNFAWGYQHSGIYVDPQGSVYRYAFRRGDRPWQQAHPPSATLQELEEKFSHERVLIGRVSPDELRQKQALVTAAAPGPYSRPVNAAFDAGTSATTVWVFDEATNLFEEVELQIRGDWRYDNLAPAARQLSEWLGSLSAVNKDAGLAAPQRP